jgi:hypothetical protein
LIGGHGLQAVLDDNLSIYVADESPRGESRYRARFYFDPNSIVMADGDTHTIFAGLSNTSSDTVRVEFRRSAGNYQIRGWLTRDGAGGPQATSWITISDGPHAIELDWQAATASGANNGGLTLWIDDVQQASLTGIDNDAWRIESARLGGVAGIDAGTRGAYFFDAFESRRQTYIGLLTSGPTPILTPTPSPTPAASSTPTDTPIPSAGDILYVSSTTGGNLSFAFSDEDILAYDTGASAWAMAFDGSDVGLSNADVDAFDFLPNGDILLSFGDPITLTGFGPVDDSDIVRFVPTSLGNATAGSWQWYFDGSDVGLTTDNEDIDAIGFAPDGRLLISTFGAFGVSGASGEGEDLIAFTPAQLGQSTSGAWAMYFDGSDVGLSSASTEDVWGVWVDGASGAIYLKTQGAFAVSGASGDGADVFVCAPITLGATTACAFGPGLYWDGSAHGFGGEVIDDFSIERQ